MSTLADARRERVMAAALIVAERDGWQQMTRERVAAEAGVAAGTVNNAVGVGGTMAGLRDAVMAEAVKRCSVFFETDRPNPGRPDSQTSIKTERRSEIEPLLVVVAQGLAAGHSAAKAAPAEVRQGAMALLVG